MPGRPLAAALACAAAAVTVHAVALGTDAGGRVDAAILGALAGRGGATADALGADVVRFFDPVPFALLGAALVCLAVALARPREAVVVAGVLAGAAVTSQLLKAGLAAPRPHPTPAAAPIAPAAWPSGHTTAATALALCAALVAPPRLRRGRGGGGGPPRGGGAPAAERQRVGGVSSIGTGPRTIAWRRLQAASARPM